ncbi:MAG: DUF1788 domain-containing protein [Anaplasmataceae bacterium]|nr:DUF1788 domain-containing protein [Anaplasmataceae bacterium]
MASRIESLLYNYDKIVNEPWSVTLSGQEKVWFLVYDPAEQRKIDLRTGDFEGYTKKAGKNWVEINLKSCFPQWMSNHDYKEEYFAQPVDIADQIESDFRNYVVRFLNEKLSDAIADENTVVAITQVSSLFGFLMLSDILKQITNSIKGRLLIFFPGEYKSNHYRLMDARDGWSYLARPILA